jgi:hypothetical protein
MSSAAEMLFRATDKLNFIFRLHSLNCEYILMVMNVREMREREGGRGRNGLVTIAPSRVYTLESYWILSVARCKELKRQVCCSDPQTALRIVLYAASVLFSSVWISGCCRDGTVSDTFGHMVEVVY